ncbi:PepSY domain-containing protein [Streptomyces sp. NPDC007083]|uniref:PepSY domain-containing protein n=1 Tax=Streptomyces sp. NPDC007083 TaxID=3156913 RepID=UPI0033CC0DCE
MKRKVIIATVAAAALVGGGTATAFGVAGHDSDPAGASTASGSPQSNGRAIDQDDDRGDHEDGKGGRSGGRAGDARTAEVSFGRAAEAVLKEVPGAISELELDTDGDWQVWEADVLAEDGTWHDVKIDATTGDVVKNAENAENAENGVDTRKDDERSVVRSVELDAATAGKKAAAAAEGAVTSVGLEDDGRDKGRWEAEAVDEQGTEHELVLDGTSGKVLHHETEQDED